MCARARRRRYKKLIGLQPPTIDNPKRAPLFEPPGGGRAASAPSLSRSRSLPSAVGSVASMLARPGEAGVVFAAPLSLRMAVVPSLRPLASPGTGSVVSAGASPAPVSVTQEPPQQRQQQKLPKQQQQQLKLAYVSSVSRPGSAVGGSIRALRPEDAAAAGGAAAREDMGRPPVAAAPLARPRPWSTDSSGVAAWTPMLGVSGAGVSARRLYAAS